MGRMRGGVCSSYTALGEQSTVMGADLWSSHFKVTHTPLPGSSHPLLCDKPNIINGSLVNFCEISALGCHWYLRKKVDAVYVFPQEIEF